MTETGCPVLGETPTAIVGHEDESVPEPVRLVRITSVESDAWRIPHRMLEADLLMAAGTPLLYSIGPKYIPLTADYKPLANVKTYHWKCIATGPRYH